MVLSIWYWKKITFHNPHPIGIAQCDLEERKKVSLCFDGQLQHRARPRSVEACDGRGEHDGRVAVKALLAAVAAADVVVAQYIACVHEGRLKRKPAYFWGSARRRRPRLYCPSYSSFVKASRIL